MRKLRICHAVESYYPSVGGMQEVVRQLSERLIKLGHAVTVVTKTNPGRSSTNHNGVVIREFAISGNAVEGYTGNTQTYIDFLEQETKQFDVITFFAAQQWATDLALPVLNKIKAKKVNVPTGYSHLFTPTYSTYFEKMKTWIREYDMNVFLSDDYRDINFAREQGIKKIILIPNGAGEDEFSVAHDKTVLRTLGVSDGDFVLLHVGSFVYSKGQADAVDIFLKSELVHATLILVGNKPENFIRQLRRRPFLLLRYWLSRLLGSKKIIHTSLPRETTVALYHEADLFFFPSMIECSPIVLFEAMAAEKPFLVTDVGNSAEIVKWSKGGWIMPTDADPNGFSRARIRESAELLTKLATDQQKLNEARWSGHAAWKEKFSWEIIAKQYEEMYLKLVDENDRS